MKKETINSICIWIIRLIFSSGAVFCGIMGNYPVFVILLAAFLFTFLYD